MFHNNGMLRHKRWLCAVLVVATLLMALPAAMAASRTGTIQNPNGQLVNLRAWASMDASVVCTLEVGTKVEINGKTGSWYAVVAGSASGYVHSGFVALDGSSTHRTAKLTSDANLYESASQNACVLVRLSKGTQVTVLDRGDKWTKVSYGNCTGYILSSALRTATTSPTPEKPEKPGKPDWQVPSKPQKPSKPITTQNANATVRTFNGGNLNLRTWANMNADVLASIPNGTRIRIVTHGATWCKVQVGSLVGYMSTKYLVFDGGNPHYGNSPNYGNKSASVASNSVNLRVSPSLNSSVLSKLGFGTSVQVLGVGSEWVRVNANGRLGYIKTDLLNLPSGATPHKTVVNNGSYVNLRSGAGYEYGVLKQVPHGSAATVVIPYEIWSKVIVKDGGGYLGGYMMNNFLK